MAGTLNTGMTVYEFNEQVAKSRGRPLNKEERLDVACALSEWAETPEIQNSKYILAYGAKANYITMFVRHKKNHSGSLTKNILECLDDFGEIWSMDVLPEQNIVEAWIKTEDETFVYVLIFPYDKGVVSFV